MVILRDFTVGLVFFDELFRKSLEIASTKSGKEAEKENHLQNKLFRGYVGSQGILICI